MLQDLKGFQKGIEFAASDRLVLFYLQVIP